MRGRAIIIFALICAGAGQADAASPVQQAFQVSAVIATGCAVTASAGSWGQIDLGGVQGVQSGTVSATLVSPGGAGLVVDCTPGTMLAVTADNGSYASGGMRQLALATDPTRRIPYQLFANGSGTPWSGQSVAMSFPVGTSRLALPIAATATLPGVQKAGAYADTVQITIQW